MRKFSPVKLLVFFLAATFIIHQLVSIFYKPISTENAYFYTANEGFNITGIIIRNESLVKTNKEGVMHYMIPDGHRISNGGTIANIYNDEASSITLSRIEVVKEKINDIESIIAQNNIQAANLDVANTNIDNKFNDMIFSSSSGDFSLIAEKSGYLLTALNKRQAILGNTTDFSNQLNSLNSELNSLESKLTNPIGKIKASKSGYFISKTDGYESSFNIEDLSTITPEYLKNFSKKTYENNVVGKIVSDYEWYIAANVSVNDSLNFKEGDSLSIHTTVNTSPTLSATVKKINISNDGTDAVIIFACSDMNSELAAMRSGAMTVVKQEFSGLRVPKNAIRFVDSVRGVFVVSGMQIKFTPVNIVFTGEDYVLCEKSDEEGALRLYDQVVVKGKNLYDGKIIS